LWARDRRTGAGQHRAGLRKIVFF